MTSWRIPLSICAAACGLMLVPVAVADGKAPPIPAAAPSGEVDPGLGITTVRLWDAGVAAKDIAPEDIPTLTIFWPQRGHANGTAAIVAPGGAYRILVSNMEGRQVADWLTARGVTAFVLKYRVGPKHLFPSPLLDAQRALRFVRFHAKDYLIAPDRIGIVGFSAGGHLAALTGTSFHPGPATAASIDEVSDRPDFVVLGYPWMDAMQPRQKPTLIASYQALMHIPESERARYADEYTPTSHVTGQAAPAFIYGTADDARVNIAATIQFYAALVAAGVPAEMHVFERGGHGSGLGNGDAALDEWPSLLEAWLRSRGLLDKKSPQS